MPLLALSVSGALVGTAPAHAQRAADPELEALIPDSAVSDPAGWAKTPQPAPPTQPTPPQSSAPEPGNTADVRADSPLSEPSRLDLAWPDSDSALALPAFVPLEPEPDLRQSLAEAVATLPHPLPARRGRRPRDATNTVREARYTLAYPGAAAAFPERAAFEARFRALSALETLSGKEQDNAGQIAVRANTDRELLERLLRVYGYYDGEVLQTIGGVRAGERASQHGPRVRFDLTPGARYRFGTIDLGNLAETGSDLPELRGSLAIAAGDPLHADDIVSGQERLTVALGEAGYPFARIGQPSLLVDHRTELGNLALPVEPGGKYRFGALSSSLPRYLSARHLAKIARFKPGQTWQTSDVDDLRRAILATGLVSSVTVTPRPTVAPQGATPGTAAVDIAISKAPQRTVAAAIGYDTGEGARLELSWEHRNLFPPEGLLRVRGVGGTREQLAGVTFRRNNFGGRDRVLTVDLYADNAELTAYAARKVAFSTTYERLTTLLFQKPWTWSVGFEAEASLEREGVPSGITTGRTGFVTVALPLRAAFDHSDSLLDPRAGWRAALRVSPELARSRGSEAAYARVQFDGSAYLPVTQAIVLAGRVRFGSMPGAPLESIAPSRRFYAGGGGSIRGFGYELVGPTNGLKDPDTGFPEPKGGRSLYEFSLEARIRTGLFGGALSVVPFLDAGNAEETTIPRFGDTRMGAGVGLRYKTGFGPIRVDVGTPLGRRPGESRIGVYVALGQAF